MTSYSLPVTLVRDILILPRLTFESMRLRCDPKLGRVAFLCLAAVAALLTSAWSRSNASALLCAKLLLIWALITMTPPLVIRWSFSASSRAFIQSGKEDVEIQNLRCTAVDTLLTFCPPGPCARIAVIWTSDKVIRNIGFSVPCSSHLLATGYKLVCRHVVAGMQCKPYRYVQSKFVLMCVSRHDYKLAE